MMTTLLLKSSFTTLCFNSSAAAVFMRRHAVREGYGDVCNPFREKDCTYVGMDVLALSQH